MKIIYNNLIPFKGFRAINLFGVLFVRNDKPWKSHAHFETTIRHETTHYKQMKELLFIGFYVWYLIEWLIRLAQYRDRKEAYRNISFEREAYANQANYSYNYERKHFAFLRYLKA